MRDIKALDAQLFQALLRQVQCLVQRTGACLLRAFFGQQTCKLDACVLLRHLQPDAALLARLMHGGHLVARLRGQGLHELDIHHLAEHQHRRNGHIHIVLRQKCLEHAHLYRRAFHRVFRLVDAHGIVQLRREVRPITQMAATAHHGQVHTGATALHLHRQDVHILVVRGFNGLLVQHLGQCRHLVADFRCLFKLQLVRVRHHARFHLLQQCLGFATQHGLGIAHVRRVVLGTDQIHAGAGATLDLIEQTGA